MPVVAFEIRNSELDQLATCEVYSLAKPPHLLRAITDADHYDARDVNLRDRVEIWTDDARAVDGFDNLPVSSWDFAPTVVLRFDNRRLIDVSSEYQKYFDRQIAQVRSQLDAEALDEFRKSDGKLSFPSRPEDLHLLLMTKIKVLEISWSYLESDREQQAWAALAAVWPPSDLARIRAAVQDARARGILRQTDGVSKPGAAASRKHCVSIFNCMQTDTYQPFPDGSLPDAFGSPEAAVPEPAPDPVTSRLSRSVWAFRSQGRKARHSQMQAPKSGSIWSLTQRAKCIRPNWSTKRTAGQSPTRCSMPRRTGISFLHSWAIAPLPADCDTPFGQAMTSVFGLDNTHSRPTPLPSKIVTLPR
ncbi:MAG TPA: hypothetical protein VME18_02320 [Acidobacteriaceae bacterium]|nr:hypothetical protein [Acidobacteriaceae bacterium]